MRDVLSRLDAKTWQVAAIWGVEMKRLLLIAALITPVADAADYLASWKVAGEPVAKLTGIESNEVAVHGSFSIGDGDTVEGEARVKLADFKTGDTTRDKHMLEALGADKNPEAMLKLHPVKFSKAEFKWDGDLTLKGLTKPVQGTATVDGKKVNARFVINLADWRGVIEKPRKFGVGIADEVNVTVRSRLP